MTQRMQRKKKIKKLLHHGITQKTANARAHLITLTAKKAEPNALYTIGSASLSYFKVRNNSIAAATENEDYRENYNPSAVIVKEMAEAVVVHICSSKVSFERWLISILCHSVFLVIKTEKLFKNKIFIL